jgi:hypothetical protein
MIQLNLVFPRVCSLQHEMSIAFYYRKLVETFHNVGECKTVIYFG